MITLYRKHKNSVGQWSIWIDGSTIHYSHGIIGGSHVEHTELVETNQSGRSLSEQIHLQINSRISRMRDKGYKDSIEEAIKNPTNQLGLARPMLALMHNKVSSYCTTNAVLQRKLDGHRCLIMRDGDDVIAYSRQGKEITTIDHIIGPNKERFPDQLVIDGELYCHGVPLQTLASWIKRKQDNTAKLKFIAYDLISKESYLNRLKELKSIFPSQDKDRKIVILGSTQYQSPDQMWDYFADCRSKGFEGAMLRLDGFGYEDGARSKSLLKIKAREDAEYKVISIRPSKDGWAILECEIVPGLTFDVSAPGTVPEKTGVLVNRDKYIGRFVTVEYANLTNEGKPFHAVAIRWRTDV